VTRHHSCRVSPFGHPRIHARLTTPRGISQPPTSFIGSQCQGIHHAPLNTYNTKPKAIFQTLKLHIRHQKAHTTRRRHAHIRCLDARNHYPQIKHHTPPPKMERQPVLSPVSHDRDEEIAGLLSQSPIVCPMINCRPSISRSRRPACLLCTRTTPTTGAAHPTNRLSHRTPARCGRAQVSWCSLERR
jgi:hypothetical protein